jgi:hypothetical protein
LFIRTNSIAVDIAGRPAGVSRALGTATHAGTRRTSRAGLPVIFVLLGAPELLDDNFRSLATAAGVSLGSVGAIYQELQHGGFITTTIKGRSLGRTGKLFDAAQTALKIFAWADRGSWTARDAVDLHASSVHTAKAVDWTGCSPGDPRDLRVRRPTLAGLHPVS